MNYVVIFGLSVSSSLDNLGVGISYGIRKIQIGVTANLLIAMICFGFTWFGVCFGQWMAIILPGMLPERLGALILLLIGIRIIILAFPKMPQLPQQSDLGNNHLGKKNLISLLENPECADLDQSKDIGILESLILGVALSLNALTNGLSAGLFGFSPLLLAIAASVGSFGALWFGVWLGYKVTETQIGSFSLGQCGMLLSGMILLLIALNNFI